MAKSGKTRAELIKEIQVLRKRLAQMEAQTGGHALAVGSIAGEPCRLFRFLKSLAPGDHLCFIYQTAEEWRSVILPFLETGFERNEKCIYVADAHTPSQVRRCLREEGVDVKSFEASGKFVILDASDVHFARGTFDPDAVISFLISLTTRALSEGYTALRLTCEMSWASRGVLGSERLPEYEAKMNQNLFSNYPCVQICQYGPGKFKPEVIKAAIMTHPLLARGNRIHRNPYYVPPNEYFGENRAEREVENLLSEIERERGTQERALFLADILERSSQPFSVVHPDGRLLTWNSAFRELTGYSDEELLALSWATDLTPHEYRKAHERALKELHRTGKPQRFEKEYVRKDGSRVPLEFLVHQVCSEEGKLLYYYSFVSDITERKRAEEALRSEKERLAVTLSSIGDAVIAVDSAAKITLMNPIAESLTGWKQSEALGKPLEEVFVIVNEDTRLPAKNPVPRVLVEGHISGLANHTMLIARDGTERSIADSAAPIRDKEGNVIGAIIVFRDVTNERRQERALRESESRFRLLAENATDIIFRVRLRPDLKVEYISPAVASITGYSPEEFYADPLISFRLVHPDDRRVLNDLSDRFNFTRPVTTRWVTRNGRVIWLEIRSTPIYDNTGEIVAIEGIARDVTEQKEMEERLRHLSLHDALTGLYNRAYFEEEIQRMEGGRRYPISIVSIDIDGLKLINDAMGHHKGDELLKACAQILKESFRKGDVVARVGGDEFAVILPRTDGSAAERVCKRLEARVTSHNELRPEIPLSISFGVATATSSEISLEDVFAEADKCMYRDKLHRTTSALHGIVNALRIILAAKDYVSDGHLSRVATLACQLGKHLGLNKKTMSDLVLLAEVHDLGKVGIPDEILFKKEPLTPDERKQIEQHSAIGYRIARSSPELSHVAGLILHHHEQWDGKGYPNGLAGEDIPIECRILAIIDAYDAMTHDRPYRKARTHQEAVQELRDCAGTKFDPYLVERFLKVLEKS